MRVKRGAHFSPPPTKHPALLLTMSYGFTREYYYYLECNASQPCRWPVATVLEYDYQVREFESSRGHFSFCGGTVEILQFLSLFLFHILLFSSFYRLLCVPTFFFIN